MLDLPRCPECSVPLPFTETRRWLNNGDIVQSQNPAARLGFLECENLDPLFHNLGEIIGMSIEPVIVKLDAMATEHYLSRLIPQEIKDRVVAMEMDPISFVAPIQIFCHVIGYGKHSFLEYRYRRDENDYCVFRVEHPYSVPLCAGGGCGSLAAVAGGEHDVTYREVAPGVYEFRTTWTEYPEVIREEFPLREYRHRDADLELERCPGCGGPKALSRFHWDLDEGVITDRRNGRRMAALGPEVLDHLFQALENELGETIPRAVVEAQRRFAKTGFYSLEEIRDFDRLRLDLALKGQGNLRELEKNMRGMSMRVENAAGHLLLVGMMQGLFELAFGVESLVEWELSPQGDLWLEVLPKP